LWSDILIEELEEEVENANESDGASEDNGGAGEEYCSGWWRALRERLL
jgi:hypothetical protein